MQAESNPSTVDQTSVYRYYDRFNVLIYVGITQQATGRNVQHNKDKAWWPLVVRQEIDHRETRQQALDHEKDLIRRFRPAFNTQHNSGYKELRIAYQELHTVSTAYADLEPMPLLAALKSKVPLVVGAYRDGPHDQTLITFTTHPQHTALSTRLRWSPDNVKLMTDAGIVVGQILSIEHAGPLARIEANIRRNFTFHDAYAVMKNACIKRATLFHLRKVVVTDTHLI